MTNIFGTVIAVVTAIAMAFLFVVFVLAPAEKTIIQHHIERGTQ